MEKARRRDTSREYCYYALRTILVAFCCLRRVSRFVNTLLQLSALAALSRPIKA
jgi:hypothetical protein